MRRSTTPPDAARWMAFHEVHGLVYGHSNTARQVEIVNLRVVSYQAAEELPGEALSGDVPNHGGGVQPAAVRRSAFPVAGEVDAPVYHRLDLPAGTAVPGPAIIEQSDTTIVVDRGQRVTIRDDGNLFIHCLG